MTKLTSSFSLLVTLLLTACQTEPKASDIINASIQFSGGEAYNNSKIAFDFRDKSYNIERSQDFWEMTRSFEDTVGSFVDTYNESGFTRRLNDSLISVEDSMTIKYIESINSVSYFALLPYKLNDSAVKKSYLGQEEIEGKAYHKIEIGFNEEGGGVDFEDVFIYWFDTEDMSLDYLAYSFQVNGGGIRFRKAYNEKKVNGIRFADYENYKPKVKGSISLKESGKAFQANQLKLLSKIELENLVIELK